MSQTRTPQVDIEKDPRFQLVKRVVQSQHFQKAPRLREFLLFVCEQTILGQTENLTEQKLGQRIFERSVDYSPADDSIVRVQARQLRLRLAEYFHGEGRDEKSTIEIPKGSYSAVFHDSRGSYDPVPDPAPAPRPRMVSVSAAAIALAVVLAGVCLFLFLENRQLKSARAGQDSRQVKPWLLARIFDNSPLNTVLLGDSAFGNIQGLLNRQFSLEDYLRPGYPQSIVPAGVSTEYTNAFRSITGYPLSSFTYVMMAERLGKLAERFGWRYSIRHSRDLTTRELSEGNQILFGSRMSNPWVSLYEDDLEFQSGWDPVNKVVFFRDIAAPPGSPSIYASAGPNRMPGSTFAVVSFLTGAQPSAENSRVLVVRGTKTEAMEAAWDLIADPHRFDARLRSAGFNPAAIAASSKFEILLETTALGGGHGDVVVRALRSR